jgi:hypothetical protein
MNTTAHAHDTTAPATRPSRRADAGSIRLSQRDIDGLLLVGEHWGAPSDLLAAALRVDPGRLPALTARWRRAGYAATGRLGPGPGWCWLTRDGMTATGLGFPATRPALGRLAHLRAILAARLWMQANPAWAQGQAWWHSERRLRAEQPVLPGAQDPHLGGVHDADEEPGISGGVVGKVPVHMGKVPDSRQIFGGGCCVRAGGSRERRGRLSRPGPWSAAGRGSAR